MTEDKKGMIEKYMVDSLDPNDALKYIARLVVWLVDEGKMDPYDAAYYFSFPVSLMGKDD
jgi:hypothetical protein